MNKSKATFAAVVIAAMTAAITVGLFKLYMPGFYAAAGLLAVYGLLRGADDFRAWLCPEPPAGHKFSIACYDGDRLCGVVMVGRPVGRYLDDGLTLEVNRCCTDGTRNACSFLYGAACRAAKALGYQRIVTYTRESEPGTSLRASNWICDGPAGGTHWTGKRYEQTEIVLDEMKVRWRKEL